MDGGWIGVFLTEAEARNVLLSSYCSYCLPSHVKYALELDDDGQFYCSSTLSTFVSFHQFSYILSTFTHFYPLSLNFIHFHPLKSNFIQRGLPCSVSDHNRMVLYLARNLSTFMMFTSNSLWPLVRQPISQIITIFSYISTLHNMFRHFRPWSHALAYWT